MLPLLLPFLGTRPGKRVTYAVLAVVIVVGALFILHAAKESGREEERAAQAAAAQVHEQTVLKNSRDADMDAARQPDPQGTLQKDWERPQ
jgi:hypothetical protein